MELEGDLAIRRHKINDSNKGSDLAIRRYLDKKSCRQQAGSDLAIRHYLDKGKVAEHRSEAIWPSGVELDKRRNTRTRRVKRSGHPA